ncbi:thiolase family protein [Pedobacter sp.]
MEQVYIVASARTAIGSYGGAIATLSAVQLGAAVVKGALDKSIVQKNDFQTLVMGQVLSAGSGQAPARQVAKLAGLSENTCATTVNKVCASGLKAVAMVYQDIRMGDISAGIAGGMESMSQVPYYVENARFGMGYGDKVLRDGLALDGLTDAYGAGTMGVLADQIATKYEINRAALDQLATRSYQRSTNAWQMGYFGNEVVPLSVPQRKGEYKVFNVDEEFSKVDFEKIARLKPAFTTTGTTTAANSSPLSDGATALTMAGERYLKRNGIAPLARIVAYAEAEQSPELFITSPILAAEKAMKKAGLQVNDIDFFEINEAFALVPLLFINEMDIDAEKVNIFGGAVSLGHPLGNSGARILCTLINVLQTKQGRYGLAAICNGGGGASAIIIERI